MTDSNKRFVRNLIMGTELVTQYGLAESLKLRVQGEFEGIWYVSVTQENSYLTISWMVPYKTYHVKHLGYVWKFDMIRLF